MKLITILLKGLLIILTKIIGLSLGHFLVNYSYDEKVASIGLLLGDFLVSLSYV